MGAVRSTSVKSIGSITGPLIPHWAGCGARRALFRGALASRIPEQAPSTPRRVGGLAVSTGEAAAYGAALR